MDFSLSANIHETLTQLATAAADTQPKKGESTDSFKARQSIALQKFGKMVSTDPIDISNPKDQVRAWGLIASLLEKNERVLNSYDIDAINCLSDVIIPLAKLNPPLAESARIIARIATTFLKNSSSSSSSSSEGKKSTISVPLVSAGQNFEQSRLAALEILLSSEQIGYLEGPKQALKIAEEIPGIRTSLTAQAQLTAANGDYDDIEQFVRFLVANTRHPEFISSILQFLQTPANINMPKSYVMQVFLFELIYVFPEIWKLLKPHLTSEQLEHIEDLNLTINNLPLTNQELAENILTYFEENDETDSPIFIAHMINKLVLDEANQTPGYVNENVKSIGILLNAYWDKPNIQQIVQEMARHGAMWMRPLFDKNDPDAVIRFAKLNLPSSSSSSSSSGT